MLLRLLILRVYLYIHIHTHIDAMISCYTYIHAYTQTCIIHKSRPKVEEALHLTGCHGKSRQQALRIRGSACYQGLPELLISSCS